MISIQVNDYQFFVKANLSIIEACKFIGIIIPRFCYHEKLSVAASCRMCIVEIEKVPKPLTACSSDISAGLTFFTNTPFVRKARENVLEALLLNHPLDCPICDQAGECDLQDQVKSFGTFYTRFYVNTKRGVEDKNCGPLIKTIMTRCIHCTRCVRFGTEIAGVDFLGTLNRGISTEIGGYIAKTFNSEISGNLIDLCPVGALTANPYFFKNRPWELRSVDTIDTLDSLGSSIFLNYKESSIVRILPKINEDLNDNLISDKTRFGFDALSSTNRFREYVSKTPINVFKTVLTNNVAILDKKLFLINESIDLELVLLIQKLSLIDQTVSIRSTENFNRRNNVHLSWNFDKIKDFNQDVKMCFLLSSNLRVENTLLNTKIRIKFFNKNFTVWGFGLPFKSNFQIRFINLTLNKIMRLFEGRFFLSASKLFRYKTSLFFFGESFNKRFSTSSATFAHFIKRYLPKAIIFYVYANSNGSGVTSLGIKAVDKNTFAKAMSYVCYHLDTIYKIHKLINCNFIFNAGKNLLLFNDFKSFSNSIINALVTDKSISLIIIPTLDPLEFKGIYLNLEERPQHTQTLSNAYSINLLKTLLKNFFITTKGFISQNQVITMIKKQEQFSFLPIKTFESLEEFSVIFELINNYMLFDAIQKKFIQSLFGKINFFTKILKCFKYPFKSNVDDFYLSNSLLKNSATMVECSRESRKLFDNF